jgi:nitrate reductase NapE
LRKPLVSTEPHEAPEPVSRRREIVAFAILAVLIWPVIAVAVVGGYGFLVWMSQIVYGPPGPPG